MKPHPWFYPLYRRVIVTLVCAAWLVFELLIDDAQSIWSWLAVFATVYAIWSLFLSGHYRNPPAAESDPPGGA